MSGTFSAVYALARGVPAGKTVSYGQLAFYLGNPRLSRIVGCAMAVCPDDVPAHRVLRQDGTIPPPLYARHRALLEEEGVPFLPDGRVDMAACRWIPEDKALDALRNFPGRG